MIHAADLVAPLSRSNPNPSQGNFTVKLKYPSASQRERYLQNSSHTKNLRQMADEL